ncbi:MAG: AAA family ATPase [Pseudazoarcus pumilus]|nr:AAA family ATPase [Pseudazoarcus pumilus]
MSASVPTAPSDRLRKALDSGHPLIHVRGYDEARIETSLCNLAQLRYESAPPLAVWTLTEGLSEAPGKIEPSLTDPAALIRYLMTRKTPGFVLLKDFPLLLDARPDLVRGLRDLYRALLGRNVFVFLSCSEYRLPDALAHEVFLVEQLPPSREEVLAELLRLAPALQADVAEALALAMKGMMLNEIGHLIRRLVAQDCLQRDAALAEVRTEKAAVLMREACLKYIPETVEIERVGGLENLKAWVQARAELFAGTADPRVPMPAGVLFMGVSGCGKSMAAKVIASAWGLPLVRLDMNLVLSGAHGAPEYAFDHALRVAEQVAPLVLWIDEMENSFGYDSELRGGGNNPNIFSSFLTWMQEKPAGVFVVATANRIEKLPAEVIRKGRFDQLFFLDLPTDAERQRILDIHLRANGADPAAFNLAALSAVTKNWSGAEIEQGVKAGVVQAWQGRRELNERDVMSAMSHMVPLSRTMSEQIKALRVWSQERATPASAREGAQAG